MSILTIEQQMSAYGKAQVRSQINRRERAIRKGRFLAAHHWNRQVWAAGELPRFSYRVEVGSDVLYYAECPSCDFETPLFRSDAEAQVALALHQQV